MPGSKIYSKRSIQKHVPKSIQKKSQGKTIQYAGACMANLRDTPCKFIAHYGSRGRWESLWIEERESSSQSIEAELLSILQFRIFEYIRIINFGLL